MIAKILSLIGLKKLGYMIWSTVILPEGQKLVKKSQTAIDDNMLEVADKVIRIICGIEPKE